MTQSQNDSVSFSDLFKKNKSSTRAQSPRRVRFAPSPTGYLHVGGARTALYNYLFAKGDPAGAFVFRVEDTDEARSSFESLITQAQDLLWLGLNWDEGPQFDQSLKRTDDRGEFGPYLQSERLSIYQSAAQELLESGKAFYCFLTDEEAHALSEQAKKDNVQFSSPFRDMGLKEAKERLASGQTAVVRFKFQSDQTEYVLEDAVRGSVRFPATMVGDFVLMRSSGMPVFNFCCAIDDLLIGITHVIRAEEHLNNTLRQLMVIEALGGTPPQYAHISLILGEDRQKLSKRHGSVSVAEFRRTGFLPEALLNYLCLLGWTHPEEKDIFTLEEAAKLFSIQQIHASPAVFDFKKCLWVNAQWVRALSAAEFFHRAQTFFEAEELVVPLDEQWRERAFQAIQPKIQTLAEGPKLLRPVLARGLAFEFDAQAFEEIAKFATTPSLLQALLKGLQEKESSGQMQLDAADWSALQERLKSETGAKGKELFKPLRVAILGVAEGLDVGSVISLIPLSELMVRVRRLADRVAGGDVGGDQ